MNYYLPRYDLPLVLGYTGPGLSFYSPGSEKTSDLIPSFSKQEDLLAKKQNLGKGKMSKIFLEKNWGFSLKRSRPIFWEWALGKDMGEDTGFGIFFEIFARGYQAKLFFFQ